MIDLVAPARLWLLLVVVALAVGYVTAVVWRRRTQVRFTEVELLDEIVPQRPRWRRHVVAALVLSGLATLVVASAQPIERRTERLRSEGQILLLFDVSLSMMAEDVDPDRFTAAQQAARDFVAAVEEDVKLGLVSFSGTVTVEVPATLDRARLDTGITRLRLAEATAIGDALSVATRQIVDSAPADTTDPVDPDAPPPERPPGVIVLLTDGETTVGVPTLEGANIAAEAGVPVYAISFGTPDGTILDPGGSGQVLPVPVRTEEMRAVAERTGGLAFEAQTVEDLAEAYDEIRTQLGETLGEDVEVVTERAWWWALAGFWLIALGWALSLWWLRGLV